MRILTWVMIVWIGLGVLGERPTVIGKDRPRLSALSVTRSTCSWPRTTPGSSPAPSS